MIVTLTLIAAGSVGCRDTKSDAGQSASNEREAGSTDTLCLDRLLIDVPKGVEVGAAAIVNGVLGEYDFPGVKMISEGGLTWSNVKLMESQPANDAEFKQLASEAVGKLEIGYSSNRSAILSLEGDIKYLTATRLPKAEPDERIRIEEQIAGYKRSIEASKRFAVVSGKVPIAEQDGFAIRSGDTYQVGLRDKAAGHVSIFSASLPASSVANPAAAKTQFEFWRKSFRPRVPTEIPTGSEFCTATGALREHPPALSQAWLEVPFRSSTHPNLVFILFVSPGFGPPDDPRQSLRSMMDQVPYEIGETRSHGPKSTTLQGQSAVVFARENGPNCHESQCASADAAYVIEARTLGERGRPDRPAMKLRMLALMPDDEKADARHGVEGHRSGLKGHLPAFL